LKSPTLFDRNHRAALSEHHIQFAKREGDRFFGHDPFQRGQEFLKTLKTRRYEHIPD
jgi:hypothetical protein